MLGLAFLEIGKDLSPQSRRSDGVEAHPASVTAEVVAGRLTGPERGE